MPVARRVLALSALGMVALGACSNSTPPINRKANSGTATASVQAGKQTVTIETGDDYRFHPSTIVVHPGLVTIVLKHTGTGAPHNFSVVGFPGDYVPDIKGGQTGSVTFMAPAVSTSPYEFECTIHVTQGQTGKLYVRNP